MAREPTRSDGEARMDAWGESLDEIMEALNVGFEEVTTDDSLLRFVKNISRDTADYNSSQFLNMIKATMSIDHYAYEPWLASHMKSFVSENVGLINKLTNETYSDIRRIVESGLRSGATYKEISDDILDGTDLASGRFSKTENRARLIARDQIGKFNGGLTNIRQQSIGVTTYYWRTAGDERVRESHDVLDGMLCQWDDDSVYSEDDGETWESRNSIGAYEGPPGEDYQCRCWAEARLEPLDETEEEE
jgi:SPP1 gp7 family putative phage head morphogenesis protein